jgi:hypothetical protein
MAHKFYKLTQILRAGRIILSGGESNSVIRYELGRTENPGKQERVIDNGMFKANPKYYHYVIFISYI